MRGCYKCELEIIFSVCYIHFRVLAHLYNAYNASIQCIQECRSVGCIYIYICQMHCKAPAGLSAMEETEVCGCVSLALLPIFVCSGIN